MTNYAKRMESLQQAMGEWGADILFLNPGSDFYYYTGIPVPKYYGEMRLEGDWVSGLLVSHEHQPRLLMHEVSGMGKQAAEDSWIRDVRTVSWGGDAHAGFAEAFGDFLPAGKTIAVGRDVWGQAVVAITRLAPEAKLMAATPAMMDRMRAIKDDQELDLMHKVARVTDITLGETIKRMQPGMSELDIAMETEYQFREAGADEVSFEAGIIAVAQGSASDRKILDRNHTDPIPMGTAIAFDIGGKLHGYCSDFGRTVFMGQPHPKALAAYNCLTEANRSLVQTLSDGSMTAEGAAQFVARMIAERGFGDIHYHPGLGHCIGLDVHENPWIFPGITEVLRAGMCFTSEPKIWAPGEFYVRVEDVVAVGSDGAESLTQFTYEPLVIE